MSSTDWRADVKHTNERLRVLYKDAHRSDIVFELKASTGAFRLFPAHKLILSMTSTVFDEMFFSQETEPKQTIKLEGIDFDAFEQVLRYAYLDETFFPDITIAINTAIASKRFKIQHLYKSCIAYLQLELSAENTFTIYEAGLQLDDEDLKTCALGLIQEETESVLIADDIKTLSKESVLFLLPSLTSVQNVVLLFLGLLRWAMQACLKVEKEDTPKNLRCVMRPFLPSIEFLRMPTKAFIHSVCSTGIFTNDECIAIALNTERNEKIVGILPDWCNRCVGVLTARTSCILFPKVKEMYYADIEKWECAFSVEEEGFFLTCFTHSVIVHWQPEYGKVPLKAVLEIEDRKDIKPTLFELSTSLDLQNDFLEWRLAIPCNIKPQVVHRVLVTLEPSQYKGNISSYIGDYQNKYTVDLDKEIFHDKSFKINVNTTKYGIIDELGFIVKQAKNLK